MLAYYCIVTLVETYYPLMRPGLSCTSYGHTLEALIINKKKKHRKWDCIHALHALVLTKLQYSLINENILHLKLRMRRKSLFNIQFTLCFTFKEYYNHAKFSILSCHQKKKIVFKNSESKNKSIPLSFCVDQF